MPAHAWAPISAPWAAAIEWARLLAPVVVVKAMQTRPFCPCQSALRPSSRDRPRGERPTSIEPVLAADSRCPVKQREMRWKPLARRMSVSRLFSFACQAYPARALRTAVILKHDEENGMKRVSTDIRESDVPRSTSARRLMFCADEVKLFRGTVVAPSLPQSATGQG